MSIDFSQVEFDESNPEPRCPCVLLLDTSGSMTGSPITQLNDGLQTFQQALNNDNLAALRVEVAIVSFGPVQVVQDFVTVNQFTPPQLFASGDTPMGNAIHIALDMIDGRKATYKKKGISYYRPWVFLVTDGGPTDEWKSAAARVLDAEARKKVAFFAVGVEGADMGVLAQITSRPPMKLQGLSFREMFVWLSSSLSSVSQSKPGDEVPLQSPLGWGTV